MVICCIGTPKVLGDSIAPKVADKLLTANINAFIYGTTKRPITALNFLSYYKHIKENHSNDFVIAIDCALGDKENIGKIKITKKGVSPGKALNKNLYNIGDIGILGQVGDIKKDIMEELSYPSMTLIDNLVNKIYNIVINIIDYLELTNKII